MNIIGESNEYRILLYEEAVECLLKGGATLDTCFKVLKSLYHSYNEDFTDEFLHEEVLIIHERLLEEGYKTGDAERNLQRDVEDLLRFRGTSGARLADIYQDLKLTEKKEKAAARVALNRLMARGVIEKPDTGNTGYYRVRDQSLQEMNFIEKDVDLGDAFPVKLPLGLNDLCELYAQNIVIVAGSKGAGKTALLLNIAIANQHNIPVTYFNSEMGDIEYTKRMKNFGFTSMDQIKFKMYRRTDNYQDVINSNNRIYIIDFLEVHDNFFEIAKPIRAIHEKLKDGIAIIAIQKKDGTSLGRGAEFSMEKSRLYLTMDFDQALSQTRLKIADAKFPRVEYPVRGLFRNIKIIGGHKLSPVDDTWRR